MKPINDDDDDETMSFLPPPREVRVPKPARFGRSGLQIQGTNRKHDNSGKYASSSDRFCLPWMIKSIAFMMIIASAFLLKVFYARLGHLEGEEVTSWGDFSLNNIRHWCLDENSKTCSCANPLIPKPRHGHSTWTKAHIQNKEHAAQHRKYSLDVVFLGDSIMEGWMGKSFGAVVDSKKGNIRVFQSMFDSSKKSSNIDGLVLGMAGDKSPNLLWRIQNGELPESLEAKVFWLLIGTNDFLKNGHEHCSAEVVTMGIKRVVEEVRILKPGAIVVINLILPRAPETQTGLLYGDEETRSVTDAINEVNHELKVFCNSSKHENFLCFDASDIFVKHNQTLGTGKDNEYIPNYLMKDYLHPTSMGYSLWGEKIVEKLRNIE